MHEHRRERRLPGRDLAGVGAVLAFRQRGDHAQFFDARVQRAVVAGVREVVGDRGVVQHRGDIVTRRIELAQLSASRRAHDQETSAQR